MSTLKSFFSEANIPTVSLEERLELMETLHAPVQLRGEVKQLLPSLEALQSNAEHLLMNGSLEDQERFNGVVQTSLESHGIELDTRSLLVSTEGLKEMIDKVKSLFGKGDLAKEKKAIATLQKTTLDELKRTYGNKKWLEDQTRVEGDISGSDIVPFLSMGKELEVGEVANVVKALLASEARYIEQFKLATKGIKSDLTPLWEKFLAAPISFPDKFKDIKEEVSKVYTLGERIKAPIDKLPIGITFNVKKDRRHGSVVTVKFGSGGGKLTPLSVKQVDDLIPLVSDLMTLKFDDNDYLEFWETMGFYDFDGQWPQEWFKDKEPTDSEQRQADKVGDFLPDEFTMQHWGPEGGALEGMDAFREARGVMVKAILTWLTRSFK